MPPLPLASTHWGSFTDSIGGRWLAAWVLSGCESGQLLSGSLSHCYRMASFCLGMCLIPFSLLLSLFPLNDPLSSAPLIVPYFQSGIDISSASVTCLRFAIHGGRQALKQS